MNIPKKKRVSEDQLDCYWLYIITNYADNPQLQEPIKDPVQFDWNEVSKVAHYYHLVNAMTQPMMVREDQLTYGGEES